MIKIFKCRKGIYPPIMYEIVRLRNIPYTKSEDLDSRLPKTVYCGLETIAYKGPQLWQQLPAKIKTSNSLMSFKQNIKLWKDPKCSCPVCDKYIGGLGIHINKTRRANLLYHHLLLLLLLFFFVVVVDVNYYLLLLFFSDVTYS